jgi:hypothetical protein
MPTFNNPHQKDEEIRREIHDELFSNLRPNPCGLVPSLNVIRQGEKMLDDYLSDKDGEYSTTWRLDKCGDNCYNVFVDIEGTVEVDSVNRVSLPENIKLSFNLTEFPNDGESRHFNNVEEDQQ